ncbi:hypothetical protein JQ617_07715 [Bradyrhizobium sp. KB893862 SZCCT0404]|uniref:hypothetical protein n=1 Tax=Bradyrhizobium sp. KB893862 SZCCT0404 TaxID=2807672 RepID=UPI001BAB1BEB|nr:hypothetical protein [Bradyrhizobium sp. KB893862 SZCCT0404]MBR1173836.1 hypothetical protein [Bradyrhizobium sp. KB893862 SZCCT0404]
MRYAAFQSAPRNTAATPLFATCSLETRHDPLLDHRIALRVAAIVLALLVIVLKAQQPEPGIE